VGLLASQGSPGQQHRRRGYGPFKAQGRGPSCRVRARPQPGAVTWLHTFGSGAASGRWAGPAGGEGRAHGWAAGHVRRRFEPGSPAAWCL
jgi:hypothetical protein